MTGAHRAAPGDDARWWATLSPDALEDEIRSNPRAERRLLLVVALVAPAITVAALLLHGGVLVSARVLVVDDEPDELALIERHLRRLATTSWPTKSAEEALARPEVNLGVDVAVVDLRLPGMGGWELVEVLHTRRPGMPVMMTSGPRRRRLPARRGVAAQAVHRRRLSGPLARALGDGTVTGA